MFDVDWKLVASVASGAAQLIGAVVAAVFVWLRFKQGYHFPNLSVAVYCVRIASSNGKADWLAVTVTLKKLDRGTVTLHSIEGKVTPAEGNGTLEFPGVTRFDRREQKDKVGGKEFLRQVVNWDDREKEDPQINLTPGEETRYSASCQVPVGEACVVHVVVIGAQYGQVHFGQWQTSAVALPVPRLEDQKGREPGKSDVADSVDKRGSAQPFHDP